MMRVIVAVIVLSFSIPTFSRAQEDSYTIDITVEGLEDSVAYLGYHFGTKKYLQDTSVVSKGGKVSFQGNKDLKTGVYFLYTPKFYMELIVDEQDFELMTNREDIYGKMDVKNSVNNVQFRDFQKLMIAHQKEIKLLTESLDSSSVQADSLAVFEQMKSLNERNMEERDSLKSAYGDTFVAQLLELMGLNPQFQFSSDSLSVEQKKTEYSDFKKAYFSGVDFSSEGVLRTPIFDAKVNEFLDKVTVQNPDSVIASIDYLLTSAEPNEEMYRYLLVTTFQKYQNHKIMGMDKVFVHLADEYYLKGKAPWAGDEMMEELKKEMVFHRDNQIGNKAPQIYMQDTTGVTTSLYDINEDFIILYFYSPTCGHCKKKTPVLKEVYEEMDGMAEVVAVCTDTDEAEWKKFIKDLDLNWLNYADLGYRSNFRVQYNVRSTPVLYILDKDKTIIAKKLDVEQVKGFIEEQKRRASI
ncbi:thioredoxin-like domain-containing protein [Reichenbachiella ulvae]|uniref:Thioredoxin-like domain-containing protein n=1 Tax=Reichenbachiella ulvae TaxID=2980104 RepID=A0ABT3CRK7_9BACT|nr:thioredoxin-like domain-containing protein [Reichenbachiella ulvae]MCV9385903.1 thioredoxin-like domain-containing protein [Reichenbachiella ulvae]